MLLNSDIDKPPLTYAQYAVYLPIFFQSARGVSITDSGVLYIALVIPQIFTLVMIGVIVAKWGFYVRTLPVTRSCAAVLTL